MEIDFSGLERELTARLGVKDLHITGGPKMKNGKLDGLEFESNELKNQTGIMYSVYKSFKICEFSNAWHEEEQKFSVNVHFSFSYKDGGSNGHTICYAAYTPKTNTWEFRD